MRFLPREEKFFNYFINQVKLIGQASELLVQGVHNGMEEAATKISDLEKKGDELIHEIFHKLNQTFITPLDPEDIHKLASHLDDVLDGIEEVSHKLVAYRINPAPPPVHQICEIVNACSKSLELAFEALAKEQGLLEHCIEINRLEDHADQVTRQALAELFDNETNAIRLIKLKEIYELLEITTDYCEDVADALQTVVVKNS
jgi:predicted phosphate transport protein (TIGR00153 family)